jgi:hypothetical protein
VLACNELWAIWITNVETESYENFQIFKIAFPALILFLNSNALLAAEGKDEEEKDKEVMRI